MKLLLGLIYLASALIIAMLAYESIGNQRMSNQMLVLLSGVAVLIVVLNYLSFFTSDSGYRRWTNMLKKTFMFWAILSFLGGIWAECLHLEARAEILGLCGMFFVVLDMMKKEKNPRGER